MPVTVDRKRAEVHKALEAAMASACLQKVTSGDSRIPECLGDGFLASARSQVKDDRCTSRRSLAVFAREQVPPEHFDVPGLAEPTRGRRIANTCRVKKQFGASRPRKTAQVAEPKVSQAPYQSGSDEAVCTRYQDKVVATDNEIGTFQCTSLSPPILLMTALDRWPCFHFACLFRDVRYLD